MESVMTKINRERNLAIVMEDSIKMSTQCVVAAKKKGKLHVGNY